MGLRVAGCSGFAPTPVLKWYLRPRRRIPSPIPQVVPGYPHPFLGLTIVCFGYFGKAKRVLLPINRRRPRGACRWFLLSDKGTVSSQSSLSSSSWIHQVPKLHLNFSKPSAGPCAYTGRNIPHQTSANLLLLLFFSPSKPERDGVSKVRARGAGSAWLDKIGLREIFVHSESALVLSHSFPISSPPSAVVMQCDS